MRRFAISMLALLTAVTVQASESSTFFSINTLAFPIPTSPVKEDFNSNRNIILNNESSKPSATLSSISGGKGDPPSSSSSSPTGSNEGVAPKPSSSTQGDVPRSSSSSKSISSSIRNTLKTDEDDRKTSSSSKSTSTTRKTTLTTKTTEPIYKLDAKIWPTPSNDVCATVKNNSTLLAVADEAIASANNSLVFSIMKVITSNPLSSRKSWGQTVFESMYTTYNGTNMECATGYRNFMDSFPRTLEQVFRQVVNEHATSAFGVWPLVVNETLSSLSDTPNATNQYIKMLVLKVISILDDKFPLWQNSGMTGKLIENIHNFIRESLAPPPPKPFQQANLNFTFGDKEASSDEEDNKNFLPALTIDSNNSTGKSLEWTKKVKSQAMNFSNLAQFDNSKVVLSRSSDEEAAGLIGGPVNRSQGSNRPFIEKNVAELFNKTLNRTSNQNGREKNVSVDGNKVLSFFQELLKDRPLARNNYSDHDMEVTSGFINNTLPISDVHKLDCSPSPNMRTETQFQNGSSSKTLFTFRLGLHEVVEFNSSVNVRDSTSRISLVNDCQWSPSLQDNFTLNGVLVLNATTTCVVGSSAFVFTAFLSNGSVTLEDGSNLTAGNWKHSFTVANFGYQYLNSYLAFVHKISSNEQVTEATETSITIGKSGRVSWNPFAQVEGGKFVPVEGYYDPNFEDGILYLNDQDLNAVDGEESKFAVYIIDYMQPGFVYWDPEINIIQTTVASDLIINAAVESFPVGALTVNDQQTTGSTVNNQQTTGSASVLHSNMILSMLVSSIIALLL